jgi:TolB-like protein
LASLALTSLPLSASAAAGTAAVDEPSIAVLELRPAAPEDAKLAQLLTDALAVGVGKAHKGRVVSQREVASRLDAAAQQQWLGCEDEKCIVDLSRALAVDEVVSGRIGVLNGQVLVYLSLLSMQDGGVLARTSLSLPADDKQIAAVVEREAGRVLPAQSTTVVAMERAAQNLIADRTGKTADQKLDDLRIAVLFDEVKTEGGELTGRPVERCVEGQFREAGADVVSGAAVAALKGKAGPRALLAGGVPDTISADEVDVLVVGAVEYETRQNEALGVASTGAALTISLLKVDTGEVIASAAPRGKGTGHGAQDAQRTAAQDVCQQVRPALQAALAARVKRGERIVVDVRGLSNPSAAGALVELLATQPSVGKARLKRVQGDRAIIDVVVKGGDGVALALELAKVSSAPRVVEAGPATLKLSVEKSGTAAATRHDVVP